MKDWRSRLKRYWAKRAALRNTLVMMFSFSEDEIASDLLHDAFFSRIKQLLQEQDGSIPEQKWKVLHDMLTEVRSESEIREERRKLSLLPPRSAKEDATPLLQLRPEQKRYILFLLLGIAHATNADAQKREQLAAFANELQFSVKDYSALEQETASLHVAENGQVLRSSAGILIAIMVLVVFILTATLLRSLVFGVILAYLLMPLEKFFERQFLNHRGLAYWLHCLVLLPTLPLQKISKLVMRRSADRGVPEDSESRHRRQAIRQATGVTFILFFLLVGFLLFSAVSLTGRYVRSLNNNAPPPATAGVAASRNVSPKASIEETKETGISAQLQEFLDQQRVRFARRPMIKKSLDWAEKTLRDEAMQSAILRDLLKRSDGLFSFTAGILGHAGALFADFLLTIFFAILFLQKMAEYCRDDKSAGAIGSYLVATVFNGKWLPVPGADAMRDGQRIIGGVLTRLQVWVKGYLTLVCIDSTVYCTVFYFLKVPYFPVLGVLAGCGILLPYIGPILSCGITCFVTLAVGECSGVQLCWILISYFIYNGIIEQFLLYPAVIGEALGLTTLETIVFVLLGAIFAGIPGMLFALPAASVIKYLVPQIYGTIGKRM